MKTPTLVEQISRQFSVNLRLMLTVDQMNELLRLNSTPEYYCPGPCASHNYVDANVPMAEAFETVIGVEMDVQDDSHCKLWNEAWTLARAEGFQP